MTVVHVKMEGAGLALQGSTRIDGLEGMCRAGMRRLRWRKTVSNEIDEFGNGGGWNEQATEVAMKTRRSRETPRQVDDAGGKEQGTRRGQNHTS